MKKLISIFVASAIVGAMIVGCGEPAPTEPAGGATTPKKETTAVENAPAAENAPATENAPAAENKPAENAPAAENKPATH